MDTSKLKKFAQFARRTLIAQVSAKLDSVLAEGAPARREHPVAMKKLEAAIARDRKGQVIERVAYIWFNRFSALRFMDVNDLNPVRVVSPLSGQFQPEILAEAKSGNIDEDCVPEKVRGQIRALLDGRTPSPDAQAEAYRLLLVATCNNWHKVMPFLFERIDDFTELLLPEDLLSNNSILAYTREAMTPDACEDVEVIGWLYQFYISEKKDEVFAGLKKNQKTTAENIPAATQLFTPHWIVRYLVENSLGRLWMLNHPGSKLAAQMDYYIAPERPEEDFLHIASPEEIRVCDPACGSGHVLTYAFDVLHAIYEEEGYDAAEIPDLIFANNLFGIEIDERAGGLAAFALTMKAAARRKRFLRRAGKDGIQPNVCVLENISFKDEELADYVKEVGRDLFTADLRETLGQFREAKNFGSLIVPKLKEAAELRRVIAEKKFENNLFLRDVHERAQLVVRMADYLSPKYHIVIANPPYMGASNTNGQLKGWLSNNYPISKRDLFSAFIERNISLAMKSGTVAMITMHNWMFITRFQEFRDRLFESAHITSMAHLGERAFDSIGGEVVSTTAFTLSVNCDTTFQAPYVRLTDGASESEKSSTLRRAALQQERGCTFTASIDDFKKIPGDPLAYWITNDLREVFATSPDLNTVLEAREGLTTGKNEDYVRYSFEVSRDRVCRSAKNREEATESRGKWFPYNKGGAKRKWYGNDEFVVNWEDDGHLLQTRKHPSGDRIWAHNFNLDYIFRPCISWSDITTRGLSTRLFPHGFIFDATGLSAFNRTGVDHRFIAAAICNSKAGTNIAAVLNPTMHFKAGDFAEVPLVFDSHPRAEEICKRAMELSASDWDAYETSWDFTTLPLLSTERRARTLEAAYALLRAH